ncbi:MAG: 23S rRNA (guanosine(2251)-2'-O)-methyltransferase RlmB [Bacteroidetes bacterium]|nr:23S rRNA (guanosine(2251)-2'-O)-methyltransferase RlmB [Bacteroidota bacterium]
MVMNEQAVYGIRAIIEAIDAGKEFEKIFIQSGINNPLMNELRAHIKKNNLLYQQVPVEKLNRLTRANHQGAIAFISEIQYQLVEHVVPQLFEEGKVPFLLVLDKVTDVRNFGAIARTAECMGVHAIIVPAQGNAPVNADSIKTSAGALHKITICREANLKLALYFLKQSGVTIVGSNEKANKELPFVDLTTPVAIIMGSEDKGISPEYLRLCDVRFKIPMQGTIESLNVSAAASIIMYEAQRQRASI